MLKILARTSKFKIPQRNAAVLAERKKSFAKVLQSDLLAFENFLGKDGVSKDEISKYTTDWTGQFKGIFHEFLVLIFFSGAGSVVLFPKTTEEVSAILAYCSKNKIAVVPQGGNTGLVGGSVPVHDEVVLSLSKINKNFSFDDTMGILQCDAGFILETLDNKLSQLGYMMPFDLGAKGSCQIGGNIATCAGGIRLLRYGSLHAHLLGLTVVLPDEHGTVLDLGSNIRKDNTSLHTPHLFLGSEGQLGIVTSVTITTVPRPKSVQSAMLGESDFSETFLRFDSFQPSSPSKIAVKC